MIMDHLVYGVPDLDEAVEEFAARLGETPRVGGKHEGLGTHNAILPLADLVYVELIARDPGQEAPGRPRPFGLDDLDRPRLVTWAARTDKIKATVALARERGFDPGEVLGLQRADPSGATLSWQLTFRPEPVGDGLIPFAIDWGEAPHPASQGKAACRLEFFSLQHPDPKSIEHALGALEIGLEVENAAAPRLTAVVAGPGGRMTLDSLVESLAGN